MGRRWPHEYRGGDEPHQPAAGARRLVAPPPAPAAPGAGFSTALATAATGSAALRPARLPAGGPPAGASSLPVGTPYATEITAAAQANGLDPALLAGLIKQESGFNANAGSPAGARGLTQLMPGTAAALGVSNVLDPAQSINGGAKYLKQHSTPSAATSPRRSPHTTRVRAP